MLKAIIFDLDDTLMDTTGQLQIPVLHKIARLLIENGLYCTNEEEVFAKIQHYKKEYKQTRVAIQHTIVHYGCQGSQEDLLMLAKRAYYKLSDEDIASISLFPGTQEVLEELKKTYKLALVTTGFPLTQRKKIDTLGIKKYFDVIIVDDVIHEFSKKNSFLAIQAKFGLQAEEIVVVGDNVISEIKIANQLGMRTIRFLHGIRKDYDPKDLSEQATTSISSIGELPDAISKLSKLSTPKVVVIGGGTGAPSMLKGLKHYTPNLTAVIGITDSGRSTGMLRKEFDIPAIGDMRNNLVALSESEKLIADLFQYRFTTGSLEGHSLGNLLITALIKITGSTQQAFQEAGKILKIKGQVLPCADANIHIHAELEDGTILHTEDEIIARHDKNVHLRSPIKRVFLDPDKKITALPEAVQAIQDADIIVIGPGSIYTSVITNLLVPGISSAIRESKAKKVYVCNIMTQPSQTPNWRVSDHIRAIEQYLGENILDYIIVNTKKPPEHLLSFYQQFHSTYVVIDYENLDPWKGKIIEADIMEDVENIDILWNKLNLLRHDARKIGKILIDLANRELSRR